MPSQRAQAVWAMRTSLMLAATLLASMGRPCNAQQTAASPVLPNAPGIGAIDGTVTDTDGAAIPNAKITLENPASRIILLTTVSDAHGAFVLTPIPAAVYRIRVKAVGFSAWKVEDIEVHPGQTFTLTPIELGVEAIDSVVDAITVEDLAEQQITAEEHQRILGVLPNFFVSYVPNAQPLARRQKFKLALVVSRDPLTFGTSAITAGIEQAQGSLAGYGPGPAGYGSRFAAAYGDHLSATFLGSAIFPSLLHQDPRYFYNGHGTVVHRALYAIATVVICKGDNGKWQPNYSNVLGNVGSGAISSLYYPNSARHDFQTSVTNIFVGIGEGSFGTLFQEFLLRHFTHNVPKQP